MRIPRSPGNSQRARRARAFLPAALACVLAAGAAQAAPVIVRAVVAAGGIDHGGQGHVSLSATAGQPIAATTSAQSGTRSAQSGFWHRAAAADAVFADGFE